MSTTISTSDRQVVTYSWNGNPNASQSIEYVNGAEARRNLLTNPNIEAGTTGFFASVGMTISRDTTVFHGGSASLKVAGTGATGYASAYAGDRTDLVIGATYTWSFYYKIPADLSGAPLPQVQFYNGSTYINTATSGSIQIATDWQRFSITFTVPATTTRVSFSFGAINGPKTTDVYYVDDLQLERSSQATPYFDGSMPTAFVGYASAPLLIDGWQESSDSRTIVNTVIGGGVDYTLYPATLRAGQFVAVYEDEAEAAECFAMHQQPAIFAISDEDRPSIGMFYIVNGTISRQLDDETRAFWQVTVPFQEVDA